MRPSNVMLNLQHQLDIQTEIEIIANVFDYLTHFTIDVIDAPLHPKNSIGWRRLHPTRFNCNSIESPSNFFVWVYFFITRFEPSFQNRIVRIEYFGAHHR